MQLVLAKNPKVDSKDKDGRTPLQYAVLKNNLPIVELLLKCGANTEAANLVDGRTPLHDACFLLRPELVAILLKRGANVNATDQIGNAPLHVLAASSYGEQPSATEAERPDLAIAELLLKSASVNARRSDKATPLHLAAVFGDSKMIGLFLDHGADARATDDRGRTPADLAKIMNRNANVSILRNRSAPAPK